APFLVAQESNAQGSAGSLAAKGALDVVDAAHGLAVERDDQVEHLEAGPLGRPARAHFEDEDTLVRRQPKRLNHARLDRRAHAADAQARPAAGIGPPRAPNPGAHVDAAPGA